MDELITWLREQVDLDQKAAEEMKKVFPTPWEMPDRGWMARIVADGPHFPEVVRLEQNQAPGLKYLTDAIYHVLLQDPDRVLRKVEATRKIIELCATETDETGGKPLAVRTLRLLASEYNDRPGYQVGWRP